ncbi:MAG TPA: crosslink repair DNA glycosylase YcaQ family protein [Acidimicrobiales bacterium]|nr:crosslink repair DNA glycosylase YcaQ family protein [Acidimicrobiales bacterium]
MAAPVAHLTLGQARRIAIAAQGLAEPRPGGAVDRRHLRRVAARLGVVQIDSVNVVSRSHYLPFFARLGPYSRPLLGRVTERHRDLFEYWGHEASFLPIDLQPSMRWRMARAAVGAWGRMQRIERERPGYVQAVLDEVRERGPLVASDLSDGGTASGPWWGWAEGKTALEWLFWAGEITSAGRRPSFERVYDLPERVFPASVLASPTPAVDDAQRTLVLRAARALGVGTTRHLADYYRMRMDDVRPRIHELVEGGDLLPVTVGEDPTPWFLHASTRRPRRVAARALLSPFDSLVWERKRTETLFGLRYRIEVYTPAAKRVYGYYVLPFLLGESLVGRVDVKADRSAGVLLARAAWAEPGVETDAVAQALAAELALMASWLELDSVAVADRGDLSPALRQEVAAGPTPSP